MTPEAWRNPMELRDRWEGLKLDRILPATEAASNLLGVGHALFDRALASAISRPMHLTRATGLKRPLVLFQIIDEVTGMQARVHEVIMGYGAQDGTEPATDGELLHLLNTLKPQEGFIPIVSPDKLEEVARILRDAPPRLITVNLGFQRHKALQLLCILPVE